MTPEELEKLPKPLERTMSALEMSIMQEITERIRDAAQITPVTDYLLNRLNAIGKSKDQLKKQIGKALEDASLDIEKIYEQALRSEYIRNKELYESTGRDYLPFEENLWMQQVVEMVKRQTEDTLRPMENITKTTGFNVMIGNKKVFTPLSEYLKRSLDKAVMGIATGTKTYSQAVGDVIDEMTASGVRTVEYASGKSDRIEVAARRAVMTGVAQMTDKINEKNAEELGTKYWEVEWHMGARNTGTGYRNHQSWQGKVYSEEEMRTVCGKGELLGFAGINCYHIAFPFISGISKRKYTDEWLAEQNRKENEKKPYRGREYDTYAALQHQRALERTIRKRKQDVELLKAANADKDEITNAGCRLQAVNQEYVRFSKEMGLRQQGERLKVGKMQAVKEKTTAAAPEIKEKTIRSTYDAFTSILANNPNDKKPVLDMIMYRDTAIYQENTDMKAAFAYNVEKDILMYNSKAPYFEQYDLSYAQAHEISHRIDYKKYHSWEDIKFQKAIDNCSAKLYDNVDVVKSWFADGGKYEYDVALSDIVSALSKAKLNDYLVAGHSAEYWENRTLVCTEILANINSIEILGYESLVEIKKMFSELYDAYKGVVGWD